MKVRIKKLHLEAQTPVFSTSGAAACDFFATEDVTIQPGDIAFLKTGIAMEIPQGYYLSITPRSSFCLKKNLVMPNTPGIIDEDYRGDITVALRNLGSEEQKIEKGEKIAQGAFLKYDKAEFEEVEELSETERGAGGFGSTGK